jgi:hypothetical protein
MSTTETDDALLPLAELAKRVPAVRGNKPPCRQTLYRWSTVGLKTRSGRRVWLASQFIGGTLCSSMADLERLWAEKMDVAPPRLDPQTVRQDQQQKKRAEEARQELRRRGVLI